MINFVVALSCEARPLIDHYKLQATSETGPFRIYQRENISLVVSGVGKIMAAAATAYLYAWQGQKNNCAWINVGVGGHQSHGLGSVFIAHKVRDEGNEKTWYPVFLHSFSSPTEIIHTVEKPERNYPTSCIYEMEASGFFMVASRFATAELVHSLKVISDNRESSLDQLKAKDITNFIDQQMSSIVDLQEKVLKSVKELGIIQAPPKGYKETTQRHHFTISQQRILYSLLQRCQALELADNSFWTELAEKQNARESLRFIQDIIQVKSFA